MFEKGNYGRRAVKSKPDSEAARTSAIKRLSAKQSVLVKVGALFFLLLPLPLEILVFCICLQYDKWSKSDERRIYTLRKTLYVCYDLIENKAIQEASLEEQDKVPELGHTSLPDFFEDYFYRRHGKVIRFWL